MPFEEYERDQGRIIMRVTKERTVLPSQTALPNFPQVPITFMRNAKGKEHKQLMNSSKLCAFVRRL